MPRVLSIKTAPVFKPLLVPSRYKGAWGGRGSGKSHFFAGLATEDALRMPGDTGEGLRLVGIREVQKSLKHSAKALIESKLAEYRLGEAQGFKVFNEVIQLPKDGLMIFQGMQDHTAESIKSLEGFHRAWVEEAQSLSARSLSLLRPTIRKEGSELWFSWNPRRKTDPVDVMLRGAETPSDAVVVRANWNDNPWLPDVLEQERLDCLRTDPDQYQHIWEGDYATVLAGAYYAASLARARTERRIGCVAADPLMTIRLFCDIGGTGARADAFSIWAAQFIGKEIRVLDYYEAVGQPLSAHLDWMRRRGYTQDRAQIWLPHDGQTQDKVYPVSYEGALASAGYKVVSVPNQGPGAAKARIEAARRLFPSCWFNAPDGADHDVTPTCEAGIDALGWYHEKRDEDRGIGLGPDHDWSSHGADSFGLMCIVYEEPKIVERKPRRPYNWKSGR